MKKLLALLLLLLSGPIGAQAVYTTTTIPPTAPQGTSPCQATAGTQAWQVCTAQIMAQGIVPDFAPETGGSITSGLSTFTWAGGSFVASDVGKWHP